MIISESIKGRNLTFGTIEPSKNNFQVLIALATGHLRNIPPYKNMRESIRERNDITVLSVEKHSHKYIIRSQINSRYLI